MRKKTLRNKKKIYPHCLYSIHTCKSTKKAICILFSKHEILFSFQANKDEYIKQAMPCFRIMTNYRQINDSGQVGRKIKITLASVIMINQEE